MRVPMVKGSLALARPRREPESSIPHAGESHDRWILTQWEGEGIIGGAGAIVQTGTAREESRRGR